MSNIDKDIIKKMARLPLSKETEIAAVIRASLKDLPLETAEIEAAWKKFQAIGKEIGVEMPERLSDYRKIAYIKLSVAKRLQNATRT